MTNRAVVIRFRFVILRGSLQRKSCGAKFDQCPRLRNLPAARNHILMLVVGELYCELTQSCGVSEGKTRVISWGDLGVTNRADRRTRASEKLSPVTRNTCIMVRIVSYVGKTSGFLPILSGNLVASIAGLFMLFCRMGKL